MIITVETILISLVLTIVFIFFHQIYLTYRSLTPFKRDRVANESFFFLQMIARDYYEEFRGYQLEGGEEFAIKLRMIARQMWGVSKTKDEWYHVRLRYLLHKHHRELSIAYYRFNALRHMTVLDFHELQKTIQYTDKVLNRILDDFQTQFYDEKAS